MLQVPSAFKSAASVFIPSLHAAQTASRKSLHRRPQQLARCQLAGPPRPPDPWSAAHFLVLSSSLPEVLSTKPFSLT